jgi:CarD family transcriptional regulator
MQFSVGDKVVHPQHGPGEVAGIVFRELAEGLKSYYVIDIPGQGLTLHVPVLRAEEAGLRRAMSQSRLARVLSLLGGRPHTLPEDYRVRQEQVSIRLRTRRVVDVVGVVRDLTWLRERDHLTKRDSDYLKRGRDLLASEMALVSGTAVASAIKLIDATMAAAVARPSS